MHLVQKVALNAEMHQLVCNIVVESHVPLTQNVCSKQKDWITQQIDEADHVDLFVELQGTLWQFWLSLTVKVEVYADEHQLGNNQTKASPTLEIMVFVISISIDKGERCEANVDQEYENKERGVHFEAVVEVVARPPSHPSVRHHEQQQDHCALINHREDLDKNIHDQALFTRPGEL